MVNATKNLKAVITEASFPNSEEALARISGHLTPSLLGKELEKLKRDVPVYIYGPKPRFVTRGPVAACRRLYSLRSTIFTTR